MYRIAVFISLITVYLCGCTKNEFYTATDAKIFTNTDTLSFDTLIVTGTNTSTTKAFKLINIYDAKLKISELKLMGGSSSPYKININGFSKPKYENLIIEPNDSIYCFVNITPSVGQGSLPFNVIDSIKITTNNSNKFVYLNAYGQNVHLIKNDTIKVNTTWQNDKPYLIYGKLFIDSNATLTINPGCKIYARNQANAFVVKGTLKANGTFTQPIVFTNDRLDEPYNDLPGSWQGIQFLNKSKNNELEFVTIKNALIAIDAEGGGSFNTPKLKISKCILANNYEAGILGVFSSIDIDNSLLRNNNNNMYFYGGGKYNVVNCTSVGLNTKYVFQRSPIFYSGDFINFNGINNFFNNSVNVTNSIFWMNVNTVLPNSISIEKKGNLPFSVNFTNCIYAQTTDALNSNFTNSFKNANPLFDSINFGRNFYNLQINNASSPAINRGIATSFTKDLNNNPRVVGSATDIGCYEKQ